MPDTPIIISEEFEPSTNDVIDWLIYYDKGFIRLNRDTSGNIDKFHANLNNNVLNFTTIKNETYNLNDFSSTIWFRRGKISIKDFPKILRINSNTATVINNYLEKEIHILNQFIFYTLYNQASGTINNPYYYNVNKLIVLKEAQKIGLNIPETIITTQKEELLNFIKSNNNTSIITKPISEVFSIEYNNEFYKVLTKVLNEATIDLMPNNFFPSLFQKKIEKLFEIRIFFINNSFFPMAIFSQASKKTQIDFRNYDDEKPNRTVPYKIKKDLKSMIVKLMKKMQLNSGSIDLIQSTDGKCYFIEVNPVGQFGMVSVPCNYYIEKHIALELIKKRKS